MACILPYSTMKTQENPAKISAFLCTKKVQNQDKPLFKLKKKIKAIIADGFYYY
jgi:hypothetical protein